MANPKTVKELLATMTEEEKVKFKTLIDTCIKREERLAENLEVCNALLKQKKEALDKLKESLQSLNDSKEDLYKAKEDLEYTSTVLKIVKDGKTYTTKTKKGMVN
jgi:protoporphyrinogen oxidase